jgi:hypothetical protein
MINSGWAALRLALLIALALAAWGGAAHAQITPAVHQAATQVIDVPAYRQAGATQIIDTSGNVIGTAANPMYTTASGGASGGTSSNFGVAFPAAGTAIGAKNGSNMVNLTADGSNNLNVNLAASSGSLAVTGTFWQATQPVSGTFFQATQPISAASLPLPTGAALEVGGNLATIATSLGGCAGQTIANTKVTPFSLASTTSLKLASQVSAKQVYICAIDIVAGAAVNVALIEGTKVTTDCDTATAGMAGGTTAATGWNFAANGGMTKGNGTGIAFRTATVNHDVCLLASTSAQLSGSITWAQF